MSVILMLNRTPVSIEREVFASLFKNSVVSEYADVNNALNGEPITFSAFLKLAKQAEIPYPLFFASQDVVDAQIALKAEKLMAGFTKASFSMHSRSRVELHDVELIVKDLLRKQELLRKNDDSLTKNTVVGLLKNYRGPIEDEAIMLMSAVGFAHSDIRGAKSKEAAVDTLIDRLEAKQIFVSRSAQNYMPQRLPSHVKFSGMTIKDKKVPFIFLASGDEGEHVEPAGRRLFTLVLLAVLIAKDTFAPVNYDGHTKDESLPHEYQLAAEVLMPAKDFKSYKFADLQAVKATADVYRVTPSAVAMRARNLRCLDQETFGSYMDALQTEYEQRLQAHPFNTPRPVNALKKYNGTECSKRMLAMLDHGQLTRSDFRRIVFLNRAPSSKIKEFREAVG